MARKRRRGLKRVISPLAPQISPLDEAQIHAGGLFCVILEGGDCSTTRAHGQAPMREGAVSAYSVGA